MTVSVCKDYELGVDLLNFPKLDFFYGSEGLEKSNYDLTQAHQSITYHCCLENYKESEKKNKKNHHFQNSNFEFIKTKSNKTSVPLGYWFSKLS